METQITVFLVILFFACLINVGLVFGIYKMSAGVSGKMKDVVDEFKRSDTRRWLESLQTASEQAVQVTDSTKQKMDELDPQMERFQAQFQFFLAQIDTKVERISVGLSENATMVRDVVSENADKFATAASGVSNVLSFVAPPMDEESGQ
jgi:hypothetical protein